ncbi:M56 family peptidase [Paenibacillus sp. 1011MAR3C5]|uniref:M56 family metallopeptidase n=1 Tax=Paenibacillus sp. 1011MAR3C5 TaxID=1675787 RepID=UPI000E6C9B4A|nr:M56 family metallopeptidase [Paenibacillus sp. 1011MAR3C5]RJE88400.1 M56 family peptidase [Paenibacillus sp. 1011MAR3C5]
MSPSVKLKWIYASLAVFVALFSLQMGLLVGHQLENGKLQAVCITFILFDLLFGYTIIRAIWRIMAQSYLTRKSLKHFRSRRHDKLTKRLNYKYSSLGTEILVVRDEAFVALAIGMRKPKIVLSTAMLHMFDEDEVKAILLHEWHHCQNRDNVKMFLLTLLTEGFSYLPIMKPVFRYCQTWTELLADRFAIRQMGTELHLASVLLKLAKIKKQNHAAAVHFAATTMHYRMIQVLEPNQTVKVKVAFLRPLLVSVLLLLLFMIGGDT